MAELDSIEPRKWHPDGPAVAHLRRRLGLTQDDLGERLVPPVGSTAVAAVENPYSKPRRATLDRYLIALETGWAEFDQVRARLLILYESDSQQSELSTEDAKPPPREGLFRDLGIWIAQQRAHSRVPAEALARLAGARMQAWQLFEQGKGGVGTDSLDPVFKALGVTLRDFVLAAGTSLDEEVRELRQEVTDLRKQLTDLEEKVAIIGATLGKSRA